MHAHCYAFAKIQLPKIAAHCRLTGRALFRRELLSREGVLVDIPFELCKQASGQLLEYLAPRLEDIAGDKLDAYQH